MTTRDSMCDTAGADDFARQADTAQPGLVRELVDWGRQEDCDDADLGVLIGNPAGALYERIGFVDFKRTLRLEL